jgi:hypothetical protein
MHEMEKKIDVRYSGKTCANLHSTCKYGLLNIACFIADLALKSALKLTLASPRPSKSYQVCDNLSV